MAPDTEAASPMPPGSRTSPAAALLFSGSGADTLNGEAGSDVQIGQALSMCSMAA